MIRVDEPTPGNINITCEISGMPLDQVNKDGMYCSAPECECKAKNEAARGEIESFIKGMDKLFRM